MSRYLLLLFIAISVSAQTPTLVNNVSGNNTLASTLTTKTWNQGCANGTYCTHLADASLSGNFIAVRVLYKDSPATTITVTDDKSGGSSTYTAGPTAHDTTNGYWMAIFYTANSVSGIVNIFVASSAAVGHVSVAASQWYNVATASPIDTSAGAAGSNGATTMTSGSITPGTSGDLLLYWACRTQTPTGTSFTAGTGQSNITWSLLNGEADVIDGCMAQSGIYSSTSAINPQATTAAGSNYVAATMAIKAASAGTAPTGMYILAIGHTQIAVGVGTTTTTQFPCSGNLVAIMSGGGGDRSITAVSSTPSNTWAATGAKNSDGNNSTRAWYAANASCSGALTLTLTWDNSTGDSTLVIYDIAGAAASPFRKRIAQTGSITPAGPFTMFTSSEPGTNTGIALGMDIHNLNTGFAMTAPSGAVFDAISYGGQSLDGPSDGDQNNDWGHAYITSTASFNWTWTFAESTEVPGNYAGELVIFMAAGAVTTPTYQKTCTATASNTSTTATIVCAPVAAGHTWAISVAIANTAVSAISLADTQTNTFVAVDGPTTLTSYGVQKTFYVTSVVNASTTITATFTGQSGTHRRGFMILELDGVDQTNPLDVHNLVNASENGSGIFSSGSVTTTYAYEALVALMYCNSVCNTAANCACAGSAQGGFIETDNDSAGKGYAEYKLVASTGSYTSSAIDQGLDTNSGASIMTFRGVQPAAGGTIHSLPLLGVGR